MIELNDDLLNKYIDGELNNELMLQVKAKLQSSPEDMKRYKVLLAVDRKLKNIPVDEISLNFTSNLMVKVQRSLKSKREQNYFIVSVLSLFTLIALGIMGYILANFFFATEQGSSDTFNQITNQSENIITLIKNLFSKSNVSIIGSVFSFIILISGYYFYDSLKHSNK